VIVIAYVLLDGRRLGRPAAATLLAATLVATFLVGLLLYARFLPTLVREVLPHAVGSRGGPGVAGLAERAWLFFGPAGLALLPIGLVALRSAPTGPRRVHRALLLAGGALLILRFAAPGAFRDVKEVELLTPPVAIAGAAGLQWLWSRDGPGRVAALIGGLGLVVWGCGAAWRVYAGRFLAVGL
jgi:hypothetical protein